MRPKRFFRIKNSFKKKSVLAPIEDRYPVILAESGLYCKAKCPKASFAVMAIIFPFPSFL
jgi:hypothetical protein